MPKRLHPDDHRHTTPESIRVKFTFDLFAIGKKIPDLDGLTTAVFDLLKSESARELFRAQNIEGFRTVLVETKRLTRGDERKYQAKTRKLLKNEKTMEKERALRQQTTYARV